MERKDSKERSGKEGGKEGFFRAVKGFVKEKLVQPVEKLVQDPFAPQHDRECRPSGLGIILAFSFSFANKSRANMLFCLTIDVVSPSFRWSGAGRQARRQNRGSRRGEAT